MDDPEKPAPPNTDPKPPPFRVHVLFTKPLWLAMSSPGTSATSSPPARGGRHRERKHAEGPQEFVLAERRRGEHVRLVRVEHLRFEPRVRAPHVRVVPGGVLEQLRAREGGELVGGPKQRRVQKFGQRLDVRGPAHSSPRAFSCRSCVASCTHAGWSATNGPTALAAAVVGVIHSDSGTTSAASPAAMSFAATNPQPRPPTLASTSSTRVLETSTPLASSQRQSASKSAGVRASPRRRGGRGRRGVDREARAPAAGSWAARRGGHATPRGRHRARRRGHRGGRGGERHGEDGARQCASETPTRCPGVASAGARATERGGGVRRGEATTSGYVFPPRSRLARADFRKTPARPRLRLVFRSRRRQTGKTRVDPTLQRSGTRARLRLACKKRARNSKSRGRADPSRRAPRRSLAIPRGRRRDASGDWGHHR